MSKSMTPERAGQMALGSLISRLIDRKIQLEGYAMNPETKRWLRFFRDLLIGFALIALLLWLGWRS